MSAFYLTWLTHITYYSDVVTKALVVQIEQSVQFVCVCVCVCVSVCMSFERNDCLHR